MVRGLTTYVNRGMETFMEDYEIPQNSTLVMDGSAAAVNIYLRVENRNSCFGGDYEKYADAVRSFFKTIHYFNITPYVLMDGAANLNNSNTVERLIERIKRSVQIEPTDENEFLTFPIFLYEVFKLILKEMDIPMVMCDFDCKKEAANIAYELNCPLLAYDSDHFIFNVKYIPFVLDADQQNLYVFRKFHNEKVNDTNPCRSLGCKIFNRAKFLEFTGLTQEKLPILTILLGNYSIPRVENVPHLCSFLNLQRCGSFLEMIIKWVALTDLREVVGKVKDFYERMGLHRDFKSLLHETIKYYTIEKSKFLKYFQPNCEERPCAHEYKNVSNIFIGKYRKGFYEHNFLGISLFHKYYPKPLIENLSKDYCHKISFPIIKAIYKMLTDDSNRELLLFRRSGVKFFEEKIPKCNVDIPSYENMLDLTEKDKLKYFLKILNIENDVHNFVELFSMDWHLLLLTLKYMTKISEVGKPLIHSVVLSKIILSYVDKTIGRIRTSRDLNNCSKTKSFKVSSFSGIFEEISISDSIKVIENFLEYFEMSIQIKSDDTLLDRNIIHSMSEFQSCLFHIDILNDLFGMVFEKCRVFECYNGTFIYNIFSKLQNDPQFVTNLLKPSPTILKCFNFILSYV